jgi:polyhydroxybutyrate depolymerase
MRFVLLFMVIMGVFGVPVAARDVYQSCAFTSQWPMGMSEHTLMSEGQSRRYLIYLPSTYTIESGLPLVLSFHGFASTPEQNVSWSHMEQIAEQYSFIAVFPAGEGSPATWNSGSNLISSGTGDDLIFIMTLLDHIETHLCVDVERVYAVGFSAGAGMVARLACEIPERIAAIGTVSGAFDSLSDDCAPRAMPIMMFHGDADMVVPYSGMWGFRDPLSSAQEWAAHNGCLLPPLTLSRKDDISPMVFGECENSADVIFYTVRGGGHTWPGSDEETSILAGKTSHTMDAGEEFWLFFRQYSRVELTAQANRADQIRQPANRAAAVSVGQRLRNPQ